MENDVKKLSIIKSVVEATSEPGLYSDSTLVGFRLKITPAGSKVYLVQSKVKGEQKPVKVTIGTHGQPWKDGGLLTAEKARREAEKIRGQMLDGVNPNTQSKNEKAAELAKQAKAADEQKKSAITLREVFMDYVLVAQSRGDRPLKDSTKVVYQQCLFSACKSWLDQPLAAITEERVRQWYRDTAGTKDEPVHAGLASLVTRVLCALFNFAIHYYRGHDGEPLFISNPIACLRKEKLVRHPKPRTGLIRDYQLGIWFEAVKSLNHPNACDYFQVLLLTGCRAQEVAGLRWRDINFTAKEVVIFNKKRDRQYRLPLTEYLFNLLWDRYHSEFRMNEFVFPADSGVGNQSVYDCQLEFVIKKCRTLFRSSSDETLRRDADDFSFMCHDLRRTMTTIASIYLSDTMVRALTDHAGNDVVSRHYTHVGVEQLRQPLQLVHDHILKHAGIERYESTSAKKLSAVVRLSDRRKPRAIDTGKA